MLDWPCAGLSGNQVCAGRRRGRAEDRARQRDHLGGRISGLVTYFDLKQDNVTQADNTPGRTGYFIQVSGQRSTGLEFSLNGRITDQWLVMGGFSYTDAGQLLGHVLLGLEQLETKLRQVDARTGKRFDDELELELAELVAAVEAGTIEPEVIDQACRRILTTQFRFAAQEDARPGGWRAYQTGQAVKDKGDDQPRR